MSDYEAFQASDEYGASRPEVDSGSDFGSDSGSEKVTRHKLPSSGAPSGIFEFCGSCKQEITEERFVCIDKITRCNNCWDAWDGPEVRLGKNR